MQSEYLCVCVCVLYMCLCCVHVVCMLCVCASKLVSRSQTAFSRFSLWGWEKGSGNIVSIEWCSDTFAL